MKLLAVVLFGLFMACGGDGRVPSQQRTMPSADDMLKENRDAVKTYNRVAVKDLAARFPGLDWAAWTTELGVADAPHLVVSQPSVFATLAKTVGSTYHPLLCCFGVPPPAATLASFFPMSR